MCIHERYALKKSRRFYCHIHNYINWHVFSQSRGGILCSDLPKVKFCWLWAHGRDQHVPYHTLWMDIQHCNDSNISPHGVLLFQSPCFIKSIVLYITFHKSWRTHIQTQHKNVCSQTITLCTCIESWVFI